jgi:di/tricarboxylate transporter
MSVDVVGILVLGLIFLVGTWRSINLGALALVAAILLGTSMAGLSLKEVYAGFPADLFVLIMGVTFLFGVATANGTVEWVVERAAHLVGDRPRALPWVLFVVAAIPTTAGALGPAGVAILAPLGLRLAQRYNMNPVLAGLMIVHGSAVGNFSPINVLGAIANQTMEREGLPSNPILLFIGNLVFNALLAVAIYWIYGGGLHRWRHRRNIEIDSNDATLGAATHDHHPSAGPGSPIEPAGSSGAPHATTAVMPDTGTTPAKLTRPQVVTAGAVVLVLIGAIGFGLDIGVLALIAAVILRLVTPQSSLGAEKSIAWNVVLLICGILTYVALLQHIGTIDRLGTAVADMRIPLLAAFIICLIAGAVSAFASSAGTIGALIPLSVPLLALGELSTVGFVIALSISATAVDATPFSTVGALTVANAPASQQQQLFKGMLRWGLSMILVAPASAWLIFVLIPSV